MDLPAGEGLFGVPAEARILTAFGWRPLADVEPGTPLAHPEGQRSRLVDVVPLGQLPMAEIFMADGTSFIVSEHQVLNARLGDEQDATWPMDATLIHDARLRGRRVRLPRHRGYEFGSQ